MVLDKYHTVLQQLCAEHKVKSLYAFGSVLTERFNEQSDIDLLVEIDSTDPLEYAEYYFNMKFALQDIFKRKIDLLENKAIKNKFLLQNIEQTKYLLYGKK